MSRRTDGRGPTLVDALRDALADLLDTDTDDIVLRVDAPGVDALTGRLALDLEVIPEDRSEDEVRREVTAETATSPSDDASDDVADDADDAANDASSDTNTDTDGDEDAAAPAPRVRAPRTQDDREVPDAPERTVTIEDLEEEADAAADFLEGLLDALDLPGDIRIRTTEDHAEVEVVEIGSGALIGRRGQTLEAIQELVRSALQREFQRRSRVKVDAEGYRARRLEKLVEKAEEAIDEVLDSGEPVRLEPMDVFERKSVHRIVAEVEGVISRSQGREPARRVVIELE
jgi:spoIIIJ-associated protein